MQATSLIDQINNDLALQLEPRLSEEALIAALGQFVNELIQSDFDHLIRILYRTDIQEATLKQLLKTHADQDAGHIIAVLIVERQKQKLESRKQFMQSSDDIPLDERW